MHLLITIKVYTFLLTVIQPTYQVARDLNMYTYSSLTLSCEGVPFSVVNGTKADALLN